MAIELTSPSETLSVAEILAALGINGDDATEDSETYLVIPGNWGPRWLIPARPRASAFALSTWRPFATLSRLKWLAIRMGARTSTLRLAPSVSSVAVSRAGLRQWFERCGIQSQDGDMAILVGNPSPDRKVVVFLLDDAHRIEAVLKVGLTVGGGVSVLHEAEVLRKLEHYSWAPNLLTVHSELRAATQDFVHGQMPDRRFRPEFMDILGRLPLSGESKNLAQVADQTARRLGPFRAELDKMAPDVLSRSISCLDLDIAVPTMLVHGDFTPWNIRHNAKAGYVLVDWEWADFAGLPAYDLLHFQFSDDRLFGEKAGGYSAIRSRSICAEYFRRMDLDADLLPRLAITYLLNQLESHCRQRSEQLTTYFLRQLAAVAALQ
ncbi:MAG: phosphotransferase [Terracidiphilus sp.]